MMTFALLFSLFFLGTQTEVEPEITKKIRTLCPQVSPEIMDILRDDTQNYRGDVPEDVVLAVAKVETNCTHPRKVGDHGEWGLLQVIPSDGHIIAAMKDYDCEKGYSETVLFQGVKVPVCVGDRLNILGISGGLHMGRVIAILRGSPRIAFRIGLRELRYWKGRYAAEYSGRFWRQKVVSVPGNQGWYSSVRKRLGPNVWVSHHNWGPRFIPGNSYPLRIASEIEKLGGAL